ncbi:MAG: hypothetical protein HQM16_14000 [Deltaproteobacteria bacterium]|nr:hypothetical protein [Deltaproteobacteria bacterium]
MQKIRSQVSMIKKNESLSIAALYAFDPLVKDNSFLYQELEELNGVLNKSIVIVDSKISNENVFVSSKHININGNQIKNIIGSLNHGPSHGWHMVDNTFYVFAKGVVVNVHEEIGQIYVLQQLDKEFLEHISRPLDAHLVLADGRGHSITGSEEIELAHITCRDHRFVDLIQTNRGSYYYKCSELDSNNTVTPFMVLFFDSQELLRTTTKTNKYLWSFGVFLSY